MSIINFPAGLEYCPSTCSMALRGNVRMARSEETGEVQTSELPGARWLLTAAWPARSRAQMRTIEAVFAQLQGRVNRIALWNFSTPEPDAMAGTLTTSSSAAQGASQIQISSPSGGVFLPGEMFGVGGQLLMVTGCTGIGTLTVDFAPRLRAAVNSGSSVTYVRPTANFMLTSDSVPLGHEPGFGSSFTASFEEVF